MTTPKATKTEVKPKNLTEELEELDKRIEELVVAKAELDKYRESYLPQVPQELLNTKKANLRNNAIRELKAMAAELRREISSGSTYVNLLGDTQSYNDKSWNWRDNIEDLFKLRKLSSDLEYDETEEKILIDVINHVVKEKHAAVQKIHLAYDKVQKASHGVLSYTNKSPPIPKDIADLVFSANPTAALNNLDTFLNSIAHDLSDDFLKSNSKRLMDLYNKVINAPEFLHSHQQSWLTNPENHNTETYRNYRIQRSEGAPILGYLNNLIAEHTARRTAKGNFGNRSTEELAVDVFEPIIKK